MRCLDNGHEHGHADGTQGRNRTEQFLGLMLLALGKKFLPRLLAQANQRIALRVLEQVSEEQACGEFLASIQAFSAS